MIWDWAAGRRKTRLSMVTLKNSDGSGPLYLFYSDLGHDKEMILSTVTKLASTKRLTLRQTGKLFAYTRLALISCEKNSYLFADLFFLMIYIKAFKTGLYIDIRNHRLTVQELSDELNVLFAENLRLEQGNKYFLAFTSALIKLLPFIITKYRTQDAIRTS